MEFWQFILIAIGISILLIVIIGFTLPKKAEVERHIDINAKPDEIFPQINNLRNFVKWSPWTEKDPDMLMRFSETPHGAGAIYEWKGNKKVKTGSMMITESIKDAEVITELRFGNSPRPAISGWRIKDQGDHSQVTWYFIAEMKSPISRYFGKFMDKFIGPDFEQGLTNLKVMTELDGEKSEEPTPST